MNLNGRILWEGKSPFNGDNIVLIMTAIKDASTNTKTGAMLQTYILLQDVSPVEGVKSGLDIAICGDCQHRPTLAKKSGSALCYVNTGKGANMVWKCYKKGNYPHASISEIKELVKDKAVRFGTYGDPALCPIEIFKELKKYAKSTTGYTHRWQDANFNFDWSSLVMASVDNTSEMFLANALNMRYFKVNIGEESLNKNEVVCPASAEGGRKSTCSTCFLCKGSESKAKSVVIRDHAIGWQSRAKKKAKFELYEVSYM